MVTILSDQNTPENELETRVNGIIEYYFQAMAIIFNIKQEQEIKKSWLKDSAELFYGPLFYYKSNQRQACVYVLNKISNDLNTDLKTLISRGLPQILWYFCYVKEKPLNDAIIRRIEITCATNFVS